MRCGGKGLRSVMCVTRDDEGDKSVCRGRGLAIPWFGRFSPTDSLSASLLRVARKSAQSDRRLAELSSGRRELPDRVPTFRQFDIIVYTGKAPQIVCSLYRRA